MADLVNGGLLKVFSYHLRIRMIIKYVLFFSTIASMNISHAMEFPWNYDSNIPPLVSEFGGQELTYGYEGVPMGDEGYRQVNPFFFCKQVKKLLAQGANLNACSFNGKYTPLSRAARMGDVKRCAILLEFGADVNGAAADWTPLAVVVRFLPANFNHKRVYELLLAHGADINQRSERTGGTPLMVAIATHWVTANIYADNPNRNGKPILQDLLDMGADPLRCDVLGRNALHWAANQTPYWDKFAPHLVILEYFVQKRQPIDIRLFTFLCCLRSVLRIGTQQERFIASSLYSNRIIFRREFFREFPSLRTVLELPNNKRETAYHCAPKRLVSYDWQNAMHHIELLNPAKSTESEQIILEHIREVDAVQSADQRERKCVVQ